jgi:RHS repeat-associated protein
MEFDEENSMYYFSARYYNPPTFISRDPLFEKKPWMSAYAYCFNNPLKYIDPTGMEGYITGAAADEATANLNSSVKNIVITRDTETGKLSVEGKAKTRTERLLTKAINSDKITVNLQAEYSNVIGTDENGTMTSEGGGAFMGNTLTFDKDGNVEHVNTYQFFSFDKARELYNEKSIPSLIAHEFTESYIGGVISMEKGVAAAPAQVGKYNPIYERAHNKASYQPQCKSSGDFLIPKELQKTINNLPNNSYPFIKK